MVNKLIYKVFLFVITFCLFIQSAQASNPLKHCLSTHWQNTTYNFSKEFLQDEEDYLQKFEYNINRNLGIYQNDPEWELVETYIKSDRTLFEAFLDPALRPIFTFQFPREYLGKIEITENLAKAGLSKEDLYEHAVFIIPDIETAMDLHKAGFLKIKVGAGDDPAEETWRGKISHGRQVFFPFKNGTWLGVKGVGQMLYSKKAAYFFSATANRNINLIGEWVGLVSKKASGVLSKKIQPTNNKLFNVLLGNISMTHLPSYKRNKLQFFNPVSILMKKHIKPITPVLSYNISQTPHRLEKLPYLFEQGVLKNYIMSHFSNEDSEESYSRYLNHLAEVFGESESEKQNMGLMKKTIHLQDLAMNGAESDQEEMITIKQGIEIYKNHTGMHPISYIENLELFTYYEISIMGIISKLQTLISMHSFLENRNHTNLTKENIIRYFFTNYFKNLNKKDLTTWIERNDLFKDVFLDRLEISDEYVYNLDARRLKDVKLLTTTKEEITELILDIAFEVAHDFHEDEDLSIFQVSA